MASKARKIIHVDMDAFFAAIEQRDNPSLKGLPVIIGGEPNTRGVVSTCSYEARQYGVHSAMSLTEAYRRCPHGVFLPGDHKKYRAVSQQLRSILERFTPVIEPMSIDEAFLDVTGCEGIFGPLPVMAQKIKETIKRELDLTASVGAAPNKFLAKIASDLRKPDGLVIVEEHQVIQFLHPLPIERLWGVGRKTAERLTRLGFKTIGDIATVKPELLEQHFGQLGVLLHRLSHGIDNRAVVAKRDIKSVGHEQTFAFDTGDHETIKATLLHLVEKVAYRLRQSELRGRTITLKLRFSNFKTITRSTTLARSTDLEKDIYREVVRLFEQIDLGKPVRLVGISVSNLHYPEQGHQLTIFQSVEKKEHNLANAIDRIKDKFGDGGITFAGTKRMKNLDTNQV